MDGERIIIKKRSGRSAIDWGKMWATFFSLVGLCFIIYVPHYVIGMSWELMLLAFFGYMLYLPKKSELARQMRLFKWLREDWCQLSFKGQTGVILDKKTPRVFGFHPHGVHCVGASLMASEPTMRHLRIACTTFLFWVPVIKEFCSWGNAFPCDREHIENNLKAGTPIVIYPGGINEIPWANYLREEQYQLKEGEDERYYVYKKRMGFIRVAMNTGVDVVPCWVDGENDLYGPVCHPLHRIQKWCYNTFRYPWPVISFGWRWVPFLPKRKKVTVWVGDPIPTTADGDLVEYHKQYHESLQRLIDEVKNSKKLKTDK